MIIIHDIVVFNNGSYMPKDEWEDTKDMLQNMAIFPERVSKPTDSELMSMFPDARQTFLRALRKEYKELGAHKKMLQAYRAGSTIATLDFLDALEQIYEQKLVRLNMRINMLDPKKEVSTFAITTDQIALAKLQPISNFIKIPHGKKIMCLFHDDKVPSLHIYDTSYYCFACGAHGTTIDIIMKLKGCSFSSAVRFLTQ